MKEGTVSMIELARDLSTMFRFEWTPTSTGVYGELELETGPDEPDAYVLDVNLDISRGAVSVMAALIYSPNGSIKPAELVAKGSGYEPDFGLYPDAIEKAFWKLKRDLLKSTDPRARSLNLLRLVTNALTPPSR